MDSTRWKNGFLNQEKWNLVYVSWLTFFVPIFFLQAKNLESTVVIHRFITAFVFSLFMYGLSLLSNKVCKRILFIVMFFVYYPPSFMVLSAMIVDHALLKGDDFWFVFQSYPGADMEFVKNYLSWEIGIILIAYTLIPVILLFRKTHTVAFNRRGKVLLTGACVLLATYSFSARMSNYVYDFYNSIHRYYQEIRLYETHAKSRLVKREAVSIRQMHPIPMTVVVIIGESLNRQHMSLYGYARKTNPLLESINDELLLFNDVLSPSVQTDPCLKKVLTFANNDHPDYFYQKPSIIDLFNALSFQTYWIKNAYDVPSGIYKMISKESQVYINLNFKAQDESVLIPLTSILKKKDGRNKFIVIHLTGSHLPYKMRYPPSFNTFVDDETIRSKVKASLTPEQKKTINEYDNTVLYNDSVIYSIIELVKQKKDVSYILYFPDHGEEVYDEETHSGRGVYNVTRQMFQIPFIVWLSDEYKKRRHLNLDLNRPYSIEDVIHTIIDLSSVDYMDYDSTRSIVSDYFVKRPRYINGKQYCPPF